MNLTEVDDKEFEAEARRRDKMKTDAYMAECAARYKREAQEAEDKLARRVRAIFPEATAQQIDDLYPVYREYFDWK